MNKQRFANFASFSLSLINPNIWNIRINAIVIGKKQKMQLEWPVLLFLGYNRIS